MSAESAVGSQALPARKAHGGAGRGGLARISRPAETGNAAAPARWAGTPAAASHRAAASHGAGGQRSGRDRQPVTGMEWPEGHLRGPLRAYRRSGCLRRGSLNR